jgi:hypothetical protein
MLMLAGLLARNKALLGREQILLIEQLYGRFGQTCL